MGLEAKVASEESKKTEKSISLGRLRKYVLDNGFKHEDYYYFRNIGLGSDYLNLLMGKDGVEFVGVLGSLKDSIEFPGQPQFAAGRALAKIYRVKAELIEGVEKIW